MSDPTVEGKKPKVEVKPGFASPIPGHGSVPDHVHPETRMAKGIDPETKERISVNLSALKAEFGNEVGFKKYSKIAKAGGFFDPSSEPVGSSFHPDLSLEEMDKDTRAKVDAILNEKE